MKTKLILRVIVLVALSIFSVAVTTLRAQNTMFTYQGRVTDNGTNFTGTGQFEFALVTSTNFSSQATASANPPSGGFITTITVDTRGSGYTAAPTVMISGGGGAGALAHATVSGGMVTGITVDNPGSGYGTTPAVSVAPPPPDLSYTTYWSNDRTSAAGSEPAAAVSVEVDNGLFTVVLGDTSVANMVAISADLFAQPNLQLRIWFNDGLNGFAALSPLQNLTPAPYAVQADNAATATLAATAATANSVLAANIGGKLSLSQLQGVVVTNSQTGVSLSGSFTGNGGSLSNLSPNSLVFTTTNVGITAWGANDYGQCSLPPGLDNVLAVAAGRTHSLALKGDGTVVAWGAGETTNSTNLLDLGQSIVPPGLSNVTAVAAGLLHSLALKANGTVVAWGAGTSNNFSDGFDFGQALVPAGLSNIIAISAGGFHSLGLERNGTVVPWGGGMVDNPSDNVNFGQSILPSGLSNVTAVSAGYLHSLALKSNGTVVAWGAGTTNSPLDVGHAGQSMVPAGLSNVIAVAAGGVHSLALKANGTVVAWGAGASNNPSDGIDFGQAMVPAGLSNVVAIYAGFVQSLALKSDGTVVVWGDDQYGGANVPMSLNHVIGLAPGPTAVHELAIRKESDAPVAWLDSDNTFNGNVQVNGELTAGNGFRLNDGDLWFRSGNDLNSGLGWYGDTKTFNGFTNPAPDGPVLYGSDGGALGTTTNGARVVLSWNSSLQVGIGTTAPEARLSLGSDFANSKLLLADGFSGPIGLGVQSGQLRFHLSGDEGTFSFFDSPAGNEIFTIRGSGFVGIGAPFPNARLDVRGEILMGPLGQYYALGGQEDLRILRGVVSSTGTIINGQGFAVAHTGAGAYTVTFNDPFIDFPAITVSPQAGVPRMASSTSVSTTAAQFRIFDSTGTAQDTQFHFIAIASR